MHKDGEPGNFEVFPGDVVKVNVNFSTVGMYCIEGTYFGSAETDNQSKIRIFPYEDSIPSGTSLGSTTIEIDEGSFELSLAGDNITSSFTFVLPSFSNKQSFQIALGLWGTDDTDSWGTVYDTVNTSFLAVRALLPASPAAGNSQSYLKILAIEEPPLDEETIAPTLFTPSSTTEVTYDNQSLSISYKLGENHADGSVKLYFSQNQDGSDPSTTLTLDDMYIGEKINSFNLDATEFSIFNDYIYSVDGATSLEHGNTYYVAVAYMDELGNDEAISSWNILEYDNEYDFPDNCWADPFYSQEVNDITLSFYLNEPNVGNVILKIYEFNHSSSPRSDRTLVFSGYNFVAGLNQLTIKGDKLDESSNFVSLTPYQNALFSGFEYLYELTLTDHLGNVGTTTPSSAEIYYFNPEVDIVASLNEYETSSSFNPNSDDSEQRLGTFKIKTVNESGDEPLTSKLNSITFTINEGSVESDNISDIRLTDGQNYYGNICDYAGPGLYTISNINKTINSLWINLYFTFNIDYSGSSFTDNDYISMSIAEEDIDTEGRMNEYSSTTPLKFLKQCLIVDHKNLHPTINNDERETAFFRLDLRTNDGSLNLISLNDFRVWGTIEGNDIADNKIHLYESTSPDLFESDRLTPIKSVLFGDDVSFGNLSRTISTTSKYYYFTIKVSPDYDPTHTILGNFEDVANISVDPMLLNVMGFPLNDHTDTDVYMTLPVELSSFTANFNLADGVGLEWKTESETNVSGYHLYRNETNSFDSAVRINPELISNGIENGTQRIYRYGDNEVELKTNYYYWLECLEYDGFSEYYGPFNVYTEEEEIEDELLIDRPSTQLLSAYPNPFNPDVTIPYKLVENDSVEINVFNIKGQIVRTFSFDNQVPGTYSILFNGLDDKGNQLPSGIYFYRMETESYSQTNKMILLK
jgi:hypothetical protein